MEKVEISPGDGEGRMVLKWASPHAVEVKTCVVLVLSRSRSQSRAFDKRSRERVNLPL